MFGDSCLQLESVDPHACFWYCSSIHCAETMLLCYGFSNWSMVCGRVKVCCVMGICVSVSRAGRMAKAAKIFKKSSGKKMSLRMLSSRKQSQSCYFSVSCAMRGSIQGVKQGTIQGANTRVRRFGPHIEVGKSTVVCDCRCVCVWFGPLGLSVVTGSVSAQGFSACS